LAKKTTRQTNGKSTSTYDDDDAEAVGGSTVDKNLFFSLENSFPI
jgi:hypothetical protein